LSSCPLQPKSSTTFLRSRLSEALRVTARNYFRNMTTTLGKRTRSDFAQDVENVNLESQSCIPIPFQFFAQTTNIFEPFGDTRDDTEQDEPKRTKSSTHIFTSYLPNTQYILVKTLTGEFLKLYQYHNVTILDLKHRISLYLKVPMYMIKIVLCGRILELDDKCLGEYGLEDGNTLFVVLDLIQAKIVRLHQ
jgi:hypothetical protein